MYNLTFIVTLPLFLISAGILVYSMVKLARNDPSARNVMSIGLGVWLVGIIVGAAVFGFL
jgi:hypothetical protein